MEKINDVINGMETVHKLLDRAEEPRRTMNSTSKPKKPLRARFKTAFYFHDGNQAILYSLDYVSGKETVLDEYEGLNKIYRLIHKWSDEGKLKVVSIYMNMDRHPLTSTRNYNQLIHMITPKIIRVDAKIINYSDGIVGCIPLEEPEITLRSK